jgi:hypothetical protein
MSRGDRPERPDRMPWGGDRQQAARPPEVASADPGAFHRARGAPSSGAVGAPLRQGPAAAGGSGRSPRNAQSVQPAAPACRRVAGSPLAPPPLSASRFHPCTACRPRRRCGAAAARAPRDATMPRQEGRGALRCGRFGATGWRKGGSKMSFAMAAAAGRPYAPKPPTKAVPTAAARRNLCAGGGLSREQQQQTEIAS